MKTPVAGCYCIGDANGRCLLAHAASAQAVVAVANALGGDRVMDAAVPSAVYTFPEIAGVGLTQQQAAEQGLPVSIGVFPLEYLGKALAAGRADGFVKVIRHRETDRLLGVHVIGHNATEAIAVAGTAIDRKLTAHELADVVFAHPTMSESLKESAEDALGMALHLRPRKVLKVVADVR